MALTTNGNADFIASSNKRYVTTRPWLERGLAGERQMAINADVAWSESEDDAGGRNYFTVIGVGHALQFHAGHGRRIPFRVRLFIHLSWIPPWGELTSQQR